MKLCERSELYVPNNLSSIWCRSASKLFYGSLKSVLQVKSSVAGIIGIGLGIGMAGMVKRG
jgi:hypothetical protein